MNAQTLWCRHLLLSTFQRLLEFLHLSFVLLLLLSLHADAALVGNTLPFRTSANEGGVIEGFLGPSGGEQAVSKNSRFELPLKLLRVADGLIHFSPPTKNKQTEGLIEKKELRG